MKKLMFIQNYKGEAIMIYKIVEGHMKNTQYFKYGNRKFKTIKEAKDAIDKINIHYSK